MVYAYGAFIFAVVLGVPAALMILLIYYGEKHARTERNRKRIPPRRGFEVINPHLPSTARNSPLRKT